MKILYHLTKLSNIPSILIQGLRVNSGIMGYQGFLDGSWVRKSYHEKYDMQPVFLTKDIKLIIESQLTSNFIKSNKIVCLSVDVDNLPVEAEYDYIEKRWFLYYKSYEDMKDNLKNEVTLDTTFICRQNIPKKRILGMECI